MQDVASHVRSSSDLVIQTLKWIRKQGFKPVALRKHSKAAVGQSYVELNYEAPPDDYWASSDLGLGVVTGPRHSGPVDVDLDCSEAVFFASVFLPATGAVFGRSSKRRSHYLYRLAEEALSKKAFNDPLAKANTTIIEIRADGGHQTVMPGSVHETTGEIVEWADTPFPEVARIDTKTLDFAVKKVAIATLIVRHMWLEGQRNEVCKHIAGMFYYIDWTQDDVASLIEAVMEYSGDKDRTRLRTVHQTFAKAAEGGKVTGANALREFLGENKLIDRVLEWAGNDAANTLQEYNERFAVVTIEGKFRVAETTGMAQGDPPTLFAKNDFLDLMQTDTTIGDKGNLTSKAKVWLGNPRRRIYRNMDFIPGVEDASPTLNLWTGWAMKPNPDASCRAWLHLLYYVICGQDDALNEWMLNWFANILVEPREKPLTAPVIIGRQGAGKSLLFGYFGKILGSAYVTITNEEHIYGRFNRHLATTLLLHSEEALYGGDRKHRGIIKSLITDDFRIFEQKGVDARRVANYLRLALTSNEQHAAPTEVDDRRFTIVDLHERKAKQSEIKDVLYEMDNDGPAALFHYLTNMKYDRSIIKSNIKSGALLDMKRINFDPVVSWWYETLCQGSMLPDYLAWATKPELEEWPRVVSSTALYMSMTHKVRDAGTRYIPDMTTFAIKLGKMLGVRLERRQKFFNNPMSDQSPPDVRRMSVKQYAIENMPELKHCREAFTEFVGQKVEWPRDMEESERPAAMRY